MDSDELGRRFFETPQSSDLSDLSTSSTIVGGGAASNTASTFSPARQRPAYHRLASNPSPDELSHVRPHSTILEEDEGQDIANTIKRRSAGDAPGLGIATGVSPPSLRKDRRASLQNIPRVAVGSKHTPSPRAGDMTSPASTDPLVSPPAHVQNFSSTAYDPGAYDPPGYGDQRSRYQRSGTSLSSYQPVYDQGEGDTVPLTKHTAASIRSTRTTRSKYGSKSSILHGIWYIRQPG
jgi:hypothetical protein